MGFPTLHVYKTMPPIPQVNGEPVAGSRVPDQVDQPLRWRRGLRIRIMDREMNTPGRVIARVPGGIHLLGKAGCFQNRFMVAVEHHRLTKYVKRPFVFGRIRAARPEVFHSMIMLAIQVVVIGHSMSLRDET